MTDQAKTPFSNSADSISSRWSLADLPEDILILIIDALPQHDKTSLARACRYMCTLVEPLLYRHLYKGGGSNNGYRDLDCSRLFLTLVERRPELIQRVHSYRGPLTPYFVCKDHKLQRFRLSYPLEGYLAKVDRIKLSTTLFAQAVNIRDVHFIRDTGRHSKDLWQPVAQTLFDKKLERLVLDDFSHPIPTAPLLHTQPGLKRLKIHSNVTGWQELDKTFLPMLEHLECTAVQAASIVPGRPVVLVELQGERDEHVLGEDLFEQLASSTSPIIDFTISFPFNATPGIFRRTFQLVCQYLPQVQSLTIIVNGYISGEVVLDEIPSFGYLKRLYLWETWLWDPIINEAALPYKQHAEVEDWEFLISKAKELCPTLVELEFSPLSRPRFGYSHY
ncbi:hypothetical protein FRC01_005790 [Tulasnella sp. 417]|nr:hypothetical protein FRC01_005790 [Tulasnella sp. 417]